MSLESSPVASRSLRVSRILGLGAALVLVAAGAFVAVGMVRSARSEARRAEERAESESYLARFLQAQEFERLGRHADALRLLQACPPRLRHWEWRWLEGTLVPRSRRVSCGAPPVAMAASAQGPVLVVTTNGFLILDAGVSRIDQQVPLPGLRPREAFHAAANALGGVVAVSGGRGHDSVLHHLAFPGTPRLVSWRVPGQVMAVSAPARNGTVALAVQRDQEVSLEVHQSGGRRLASIPLNPGSWPTALRLSEDGRRLITLTHRQGTMNEPAPPWHHELRGNRLVDVPLPLVDKTWNDGLDAAATGLGGIVAGIGESLRVDFGGRVGVRDLGLPFHGPAQHLELSPGGHWLATSDGSQVALIALDRDSGMTRTVANFPMPGPEVVSLAVVEAPAGTVGGAGGAGGDAGTLLIGTRDGVLQVHRLEDLGELARIELTGLSDGGATGAFFEGGHTLQLAPGDKGKTVEEQPNLRRWVEGGWVRTARQGLPMDGEFARAWPSAGYALVADASRELARGGTLVALKDRREHPMTAARRPEGWVLHCVSGDLRQAGLAREGRSAILELGTGRLWELPGDPSEETLPLAVSGDGRRVLLRRMRGGVRGLVLGTLEADRKRYRTVVPVTEAYGGPTAFQFSRDGRRILVGGRSLRLLDSDTGLELWKLLDYGHPDGIEPGSSVDLIEVSPDEKALFCRTARYGMDRLIRLSR